MVSCLLLYKIKNVHCCYCNLVFIFLFLSLLIIFPFFPAPIQGARPKEDTKKVRKGLVIEVNENFGRILCSRSFKDHGVFVFFNRDTTVNGTPLHLADADLSTAVPMGAIVDFKLTYDFPSKWRNFKTYMAYYCEWMIFG